jgi:hypothetical protein
VVIPYGLSYKKMGIESAKSQKLLYHLTKIENLPSIIKNGLMPRRLIKEKSIHFGDVADSAIICKRTILGLDAYTPFHFHPYSSFDVAVKHRFNSERLIYICIERDFARSEKFKILPQHPLSIVDCELYDYDEGFNRINWDVLCEAGSSHINAKEIKMAECLTNLTIPAERFKCIYVANNDVKNEVELYFRELNKPCPLVYIQEIWFETN